MHSTSNELLSLINQHCGSGGTALPRLVLHRATKPISGVPQCHKPTMCIVLQGEKRAYVGKTHYPYDADYFIVSLIEMPLASAVVSASRTQPYLGLALELDLVEMATLAMKLRVARPTECQSVVRAPLTEDLIEALTRYTKLLNCPEDIPFLAAGIEREIWYRLLRGSAGAALSQLAMANSRLARIGRAAILLREQWAKKAKVMDLASASGMSRTAFHEAFRQATGTSPLQYQKIVRLQEAKRLLGEGSRTAAEAAFEVGYASPSHFNRDYRKAFGSTPISDAKSIRRSARPSR